MGALDLVLACTFESRKEEKRKQWTLPLLRTSNKSENFYFLLLPTEQRHLAIANFKSVTEFYNTHVTPRVETCAETCVSAACMFTHGSSLAQLCC